MVMIFPDIAQYRQEKINWKAHGEPKRSDERVIEIYETHCKPCDKYIPILEEVGQCGKCSCILRKDGERMNKILWATTRCPLTMEEDGQEPKWVEEPGYEQKKTEQDIPAPPSNSCGCG
jgi:thiol-disulfide isomerase/thioredoxin